MLRHSPAASETVTRRSPRRSPSSWPLVQDGDGAFLVVTQSLQARLCRVSRDHGVGGAILVHAAHRLLEVLDGGAANSAACAMARMRLAAASCPTFVRRASSVTTSFTRSC